MANKLVDAAKSKSAVMFFGNPEKRMERKEMRESRRSDRQLRRNVCRGGMCGGRAKGYIGY